MRRGMQCPQCQYQNHHTATCCAACDTVLLGHAQAANPTPFVRQRTAAESLFHALLPEIIALLQRDRRVTYRRLAYVFAVDEAFLHEVREELSFRQIARDKDGKGLVWTDTESGIPSNGPTVPLATMSTDAPKDTSATAPEPIRSSPEAERRQVTVLFCDLVDSTQLSQHLDAEEYRAVVRAYQEAAVAALQPWDGYVAQYLGDGLMVYFGWPRAHEDAATRAVHASLAMLEVMGPLNTRLEAQHGVGCRYASGCILAWPSSAKWAVVAATNSSPWATRPTLPRVSRG